MRTVSDLDKRDWLISLTLGNALRVDQANITDHEGTPVKLVGGDPKVIVKQVIDDYLILRICGVLVQTQLSPGVESATENLQTEFFDRMDQSTFTELKEALWGELADFFPQTRILFSQLIEQHRELQKRNENLQRNAEPKLSRKLNRILDTLTTEAESSMEAAVSIEEQSTT